MAPLVVPHSAGDDGPAARDPSVELSPDEVRSILEHTAEDVLPGNTVGRRMPGRHSVRRFRAP